jgi:ech hydrogenase subunit A
MGKIIAVTYLHKMVEDKVSGEEWIALSILATLTVGICVLFGNVSTMLIEPYIMSVYKGTGLGQGINILSQDSTMIMMIMMGMIFLLPISLLYYKLPRKHLSPYMGGRTTTTNMKFAGSAGLQRDLALRNYYLESYFGEGRLFRPGAILCIGLMVLMAASLVLGVAV